jgi:predicted transposase YdaD
MKESVIYQEILLEGESKGLAKGEAKASNKIALNMLNSNISIELQQIPIKRATSLVI